MKQTTWWKRNGKQRRNAPKVMRKLRVEELELRIAPTVSGFRPIDEVGNNATNQNWGAAPADKPGGAAIQLVRVSPVAYANGFSTPSLPGNGATTTTPAVPIPSPRTISNDVFNQSPTLFGSPSTDINTVDGNGLSDFGYSFGQFMDHDMDLTPDQTGFPVPASPNPNKDGNQGFNIPADKTNGVDPIGSLAFSRSQYDPTTGSSAGNPRQQINVDTSYLDLSQVYGSSQVVADALRTFSGGLLKTSPGGMLPYDSTAIDPLTGVPYFTPAQITALNMADSGPLPESSLYAAGDVRANENTELTSLTTLFVDNHNAIATQLAQENPASFGFTSWTDENLYQEARKLNIAEYENIIYTQYLPALLGPDAPTYTGYNSNVNASIATEFSTVAFRFGHSMLNNTVERDANNGSSVGNVPLAEDFFDPNLVNSSGAIDPYTGLQGTGIGAYLKGDADSSAQAVDSMAVSSVRDDLFETGTGATAGGEDLISRDIWRARDDGIGTYNQVLAAYDLPTIPDNPGDPLYGFEYITSNPTVQQELIKAYATPAFIAAGGYAGDIDPFVGGMAQDHVPGSDMGSLFTTIISQQFSNLENGDQFFYLNESFTPAEQAILQQGSTLADIITANTGVTNLQANVFYAQPETVVNGVLYLNGGNTTNDNVQITPVGTSNTGSTGVQVQANLNGVQQPTTTFQNITSIVIFGGQGNENIQVASSLTIPVTITAGNGIDNVQLGGGNNTVTLGNGHDYVQAGNGNNTVTLGDGRDNVQLGNGTNTVTLGNGNDYVQAGNGNNNVQLGGGNDNTQVGNGNNVVVEGNGNDYILAGNGANLIAAGLGKHTVQVGNGNNILINGTVTLTQSGDSLDQVLQDWATQDATAADIAFRLSIIDDSTKGTNLSAGSGFDLFF